MSDVSGIPNLGFGGGGYFGGNAATGQPAMSAAQINAGMGWNPAAQAQATNVYGPQGFGGQTAQYAALGAAYGRQVPLSPAAMGSSQADRIRAIYGAGALGGGGIGSDAARAPNQPPMGSLFDQRWSAVPHVDPMLQGHPGGYLPQGIYDGRFAPTQPPSFSNSFAERFGAAPAYDPNSFANRFGAGGYYNPGQPSQYAPGAQMPPGFSQPYSVDNPEGALPVRPGLNWYGQSNSSS
jgi:hypothetical protein